MNTADIEQVLGADAPDRLTRTARLELLEANTRISAWLAAQRLDLLAAISRADTSTEEWDTLEIGALLHLSPPAATAHVHHARRLHDTFPTAIDTLRAGRASEAQLAALVRATWPLDATSAHAVAERALPGAAEQTTAQFNRALTRAIHQLDPTGETERHHSAADQRRVEITPDLHGMAQLWAYLPADGAATLRAAIDRPATPGDQRSADQRRADNLVNLAIGSAPAGAGNTGGAGGAAGAQVSVTVALSTLLEVDQQPGELRSHGPVSAETARRLAFHPDSHWRLLITDDTGRLLHRGTRTYRPPTALADYVIARDRHCTFPGCQRPADKCDLDHRTPYRNGGATSVANLHPLCRRHHRAKHQAGWRPIRNRDGSTTWHTPTGRTHTTRPEPYPTTTDPPEE